MSTDHEQPDDPRAHWRVLPQTVSPTDDGVQTQTTQVDLDVPPSFDPIQGMVRTYR
ncbi:hypothetical protein HQ312_10325 [Rhodococcus sp. BP-316]|jgi:hypothetical protein|uniref:hypothetical protein n=1 Tax=unclassified Rhodococcus (in: high G+C Gram-positive bacteria) TaxID=192944 RepID=UPI001C9A2F43|nr:MULTISPECIES: hypothetical protein [unclassified Rhodococcus (in: high G+C Gram-positive bacteria)]MBY6676348.1 hypothetical protein [Rhodococcus sp. BP-332]MBY6681449.1 hypothetical protein [Rhodococcus sp. BP-316]MDQ1179510.1 hypothetical protein [Rhodococcus sp. SORGH_AS_0301]MDQ1200807.1 hypothetical protein [Rhodococcus sp. SORGH_AS_0303]